MQPTSEEFLKLIQGKRFKRADANELIYKFIAPDTLSFNGIPLTKYSIETIDDNLYLNHNKAFGTNVHLITILNEGKRPFTFTLTERFTEKFFAELIEVDNI